MLFGGDGTGPVTEAVDFSVWDPRRQPVCVPGAVQPLPAEIVHRLLTGPYFLPVADSSDRLGRSQILGVIPLGMEARLPDGRFDALYRVRLGHPTSDLDEEGAPFACLLGSSKRLLRMAQLAPSPVVGVGEGQLDAVAEWAHEFRTWRHLLEDVLAAREDVVMGEPQMDLVAPGPWAFQTGTWGCLLEGQGEVRFDLHLLTQESQETPPRCRWNHAALLQGASGLRDALRVVPGPPATGEQAISHQERMAQHTEVKAWLRAYCRWYLGMLRKALAGASF